MLRKAATLLIAFALASCTVLEDRRECPVVLHLDLTDILSKAQEGFIASGVCQDSTGYAFRRDRFPCDTLSDFVYLLPSKDDYHVMACNVTDNVDVTSEGIVYTLPDGYQCDSLYAFSRDGHVDRLNDIFFVAEFHKQFASVTVRKTDGTAGGGEFYGLKMYVESSWRGLNMEDARPVRDSVAFGWSCAVQQDFDGMYRFRVLRQGDSSLRLKFVDEQNNGASFTVPLGRYLSSLGYDWRMEDLADMTLYVDLFSSSCGIYIEDWSREVVTYQF